MTSSHSFQANPLQPADSSLSYWAGNQGASFLQNRPWARGAGRFLSRLRHDPQGAGIQGAGLGALFGGAYGLFTGKPILKSAITGSALGGLGSLGTSLAGRYIANKTASTLQPLTYLRQQILSDSSAPSIQKSDLLSGLSNLNPGELQSLMHMVRISFGAGAAAIAARYLAKTGALGTVMAAVGGGMLASRFGGQQRNSFGQVMGGERDALGRSRFTF